MSWVVWDGKQSIFTPCARAIEIPLVPLVVRDMGIPQKEQRSSRTYMSQKQAPPTTFQKGCVDPPFVNQPVLCIRYLNGQARFSFCASRTTMGGNACPAAFTHAMMVSCPFIHNALNLTFFAPLVAITLELWNVTTSHFHVDLCWAREQIQLFHCILQQVR